MKSCLLLDEELIRYKRMCRSLLVLVFVLAFALAALAVAYATRCATVAEYQPRIDAAKAQTSRLLAQMIAIPVASLDRAREAVR